MGRFNSLVRVLDGIRGEAGEKYSKLYAFESTDDEAIWQARSRAYVHLYLKVMYGIRDFSSRENYVTDGAFDGGIDGYYIDIDSKQIVVIQSKFRRSESGFQATKIEVKDLLAMQVRRIINGEEEDECGAPYNGKIKGFQRRLGEVPDLGRYKFRVIILANVDASYSPRDLERLTDGFPAEILDYSRAYKELLLPVLAGNLFRARNISISLDLSNKGSGAKINYSAAVPGFECDITVLFVPIIEIARLLSDYRNSVLRYNPRSYLDIAGAGVNQAVRDTVQRAAGNDFALLNNGITLICDESKVSEGSGKKHRAQLFLLNPQIINGGQTAYTLSLLYDETEESDREQTFAGQEVLVKAIALTPVDDEVSSEGPRRALIERISTATNSQTAVTYADRASGEDHRLQAQAAVYDRFGILVELKRGEFADGIRSGYIDSSEVLERTLFQRLFLVGSGKLEPSLRKKIFKEPFPEDSSSDEKSLIGFRDAHRLWEYFASLRRRRLGNQSYVQLLPMVYAGLILINRGGDTFNNVVRAGEFVNSAWPDFLKQASLDRSQYVEGITDFGRGAEKLIIKRDRKGYAGLTSRLDRFFGPIVERSLQDADNSHPNRS